MSAREPQEMAQVAAETGAKKTHRTWDRVLVSAFLAGAYISFGALVAITVSSGLDPGDVGDAADAVHGRGVHPRPGARADRRLGPGDRQHDAGPAERDARQDRHGRRRQEPDAGPAGQPRRRAVRGVLPRRADRRHRRRGRRTGSSLLTYERLASIAEGKTGHTAWETFLRGVGCNWLVCLAVWMSLAASRCRARSSRSSSRSWRSSRWASTTSSPTCSSSRRRSSPACPTRLGRRPLELAARRGGQPGRRRRLRGDVVLVPVPHGQAGEVSRGRGATGTRRRCALSSVFTLRTGRTSSDPGHSGQRRGRRARAASPSGLLMTVRRRRRGAVRRGRQPQFTSAGSTALAAASRTRGRSPPPRTADVDRAGRPEPRSNVPIAWARQPTEEPGAGGSAGAVVDGSRCRCRARRAAGTAPRSAPTGAPPAVAVSTASRSSPPRGG